MWNIPNHLRTMANTPESLAILADANLFTLGGNSYPGRIIIVGVDETGQNLVQMCAIMGRSDKSRNRVYNVEGVRLFTEIADPKLAEGEDLSLVLYSAMNEATLRGETTYVASNGVQTDMITKAYSHNLENSLDYMLGSTIYEPDSSSTPRITATSFWQPHSGGKPGVHLSILRKSPWSKECDRCQYVVRDMGPGFGLCFHTYAGDGNPLPAFYGEPYLLPLRGSADEILKKYWETLNADNRVGLAVKFIPKRGPSTIIYKNKYKKGPFPTLA